MHDPILAEADPEIATLIAAEVRRQHDKVRLIPSENYASRAVMEAFLHHPWPGNVRELENLITRILLLNGGRDLRYSDLPEPYGGHPKRLLEQTLRQPFSEKDLLSRYARMVLESQGGSKTKTIRILGIDYKTLKRRLEG